MRNWLVLSITRQPAAPARGAYSFETFAPGDEKAMSTPAKSKVARFFTSSGLPLTSIGSPSERAEASGITSSAGNFRSASRSSICRPTLPVAPTTATR